MSLDITVNAGAVPEPQYISIQDVINKSQKQGNPHAKRARGITIPKLIIVPHLSYEQQRGRKGPEFKFTNGTLTLTLHQEMFIATHPSDCNKNIMINHENGHVSDYQRIMQLMETQIKANKFIQDNLINPQWKPSSKFRETQSQINKEISGIFKRLVNQSNSTRDTSDEYDRMDREMKKCESA